MKIVSIEPTPSPHSMKINVDEKLPDGVTFNYKSQDNLIEAPEFVKHLFSIDGVKGIYRVIDFIALERNPKIPWETILPQVRAKIGSIEPKASIDISGSTNNESEHSFGEIKVLIQMFKGIPMQIKLDDGSVETRYGLPSKFGEAVMNASASSPNFVMERKWVEHRPRYGTTEEIAQEIKEELSASYDDDRLKHLVEEACNDSSTKDEETKSKSKITLEVFDHPDWKVRYAALDKMNPTHQDLPILAKAIDDKKASIRRLATAYLGMIEEPDVLPYLYKALIDPIVTVRRTAGDCISDLVFKEAMPKMIESLNDSSRLVRWRAAMFLYEVGDESAIQALEDAKDDPEFEVRMQVQMALERIKGGEEAMGSVWHQMTQATIKKES